MLTYTTGNLLAANVEALVNTVNTVGVMGKGIALQFKEKFTENFKLYQAAAKAGKLQTGRMFVTATHRMDGVKWIVNFPTKAHWRRASKLSYIEAGLDDLVNAIKKHGIKSIALPPLGCGNGGLDWAIVKPLIAEKLGTLDDVDVVIYEPSDFAYEETVKPEKAKPKLTPTRAMILYLMKSYAELQYSLTLLETQKLVYFLGRLGDEDIRKLSFQKGLYGPYAPQLAHVLYDMDGVYITGMKYKDARTFDPLDVLPQHMHEVEDFIQHNSTDTQKERIKAMLELIEGFETPLSMEVLATVDYVMQNEVKNRADLQEIVSAVHQWNDRKQQLMNEQFIDAARLRLIQFIPQLYNN